jgi:hypothetical protein
MSRGDDLVFDDAVVVNEQQFFNGTEENARWNRLTES